MEVRKNPWVIVGAGYTGERLARFLIDASASVTVTRRTHAGAKQLADALGCAAQSVDLADPATLEGAIAADAIVVDSAPPGDAGPEAERALVRACAAAGAARLVYLSSTGVYPRADGAVVDERTPADPYGERGAARLAAETAILDEAAARGVDAVALRIAGIYGPGRGVHARLRAGTYRIVGDGAAHVSRVHVDDLVAAIIAAGTAVALPSRIYNVADDAPTPSAEHGDAVAAMLGLPPPPRVSPDEVSAFARAMLGADRRIDNARIKRELGWSPRYPDGLAGARAAVAEEDR